MAKEKTGYKIHRPAAAGTVARNRAKLLGKTKWFKPRASADGAGVEESVRTCTWLPWEPQRKEERWGWGCKPGKIVRDHNSSIC